MASSLPNIEEQIEMCMQEELVPGGPRQGQNSLMIPDVLDRQSLSLSVSQRLRKPKPKATAAILAQSSWNANAPGARKEHQRQASRRSRKPGRSNGFFKEYPDSFKGHQNQNLRTDIMAEIDLANLNGVEMEIVRRQLLVITDRMCALEDHHAAWCFKEAVLFTVMVSACIANLWLWIHH